MRTWLQGQPPSIGYWNASRTGDENCWRWWDGSYWSLAIMLFPGSTGDSLTGEVMYTDYWPGDAGRERNVR